MVEMLSPGVYTSEIDNSQIVPTVSNSYTVFAGHFKKGPIGAYMSITDKDYLEHYYGKPTNDNYNDWYQARNFLSYANTLYISRAGSDKGIPTATNVMVLQKYAAESTTSVKVSNITKLTIGKYISFGNDPETNSDPYVIYDIDESTQMLTLNKKVTIPLEINTVVNTLEILMTAQSEFGGVGIEGDRLKVDGFFIDTYNERIGELSKEQELSLYNNYMYIANPNDFEEKYDDIKISDTSLFKAFARNPGSWGNKIEIAIASAQAFNKKSLAFDGIYLDNLFEYFPTSEQYAVVERVDGEITNKWIVSLDENAKDNNGKSIFIETLINKNSENIYIKYNKETSGSFSSQLYYDGQYNYNPGVATLRLGSDAPPTKADLADAYSVWDNPEDIDIDIGIGNELDDGASLSNLVTDRADMLGIMGVPYDLCVGKKSNIAVQNLVDFRKTGAWNYNNMFLVTAANYKLQYDPYADKNRWVNIAGDIAGLRANTNTNRASWWASAGLERGQIKNCIKLAFNPKKAERDLLYKNGLNPICTFSGQGTVMWGQKTMLDQASSFDRVNVRGLFNTIERALSKMSKYQVMEFNDNYTRNKIITTFKPYLTTVKSGRGIQDFEVVCDTRNNTADVISRNQLVVDVFIKPTYVAEFIHLRFTNAGTNDFDMSYL